MKKFIFLSAFGLALVSSFAFKPVAKQNILDCTYKNIGIAGCNRLGSTDDDCSQFNTGSICTTYSSYSHTDVPAYLEDSNIADDCTYPLYHSF